MKGKKRKYLLSLTSNILFVMRIKTGSAIANKQKRAHADLSTWTSVMCCIKEMQQTYFIRNIKGILHWICWIQLSSMNAILAVNASGLPNSWTGLTSHQIGSSLQLYLERQSWKTCGSIHRKGFFLHQARMGWIRTESVYQQYIKTPGLRSLFLFKSWPAYSFKCDFMKISQYYKGILRPGFPPPHPSTARLTFSQFIHTAQQWESYVTVCLYDSVSSQDKRSEEIFSNGEYQFLARLPKTYLTAITSDRLSYFIQ